MIVTEFDPLHRRGRIVLRPNASWTWRANLILLGTLVAVSASIATWFMLHGAWLILPFTVLEMSVVGGCLYWCVRRTHRQEVITFEPAEVRIERGHRRPEESFVYNRAWASFFERPAPHPWYEPRIGIRSHGKELIIGDFLNRSDKRRLASELRRMIRAIDG